MNRRWQESWNLGTNEALVGHQANECLRFCSWRCVTPGADEVGGAGGSVSWGHRSSLLFTAGGSEARTPALALQLTLS